MRKKSWIITTVISVLLAIFITFEVTYVIMAESRRQKEAELAKKYDEQYEQLENEFLSQYDKLDDYYATIAGDRYDSALMQKLAIIDYYYTLFYAGEINEDQLEAYIANAYIEGIGDKYGVYYTADEFKSIMQETSSGTMYGIGVSVVYSSEYSAIEVLTVYEGSPAEKAGIMPGDIIIAVEGERVSKENYTESINKVKGEKGTNVNITVIRGGEELDFSITRDEVKIVAVTSHKYALDSSIGIIRIIEFAQTVPEDVKNAVEDFKSQGIKKIVFDIRNNPGGYLDSVVETLDYLLPEGPIVYITDANGKIVGMEASDASCVEGLEIAVLMNENSASAAELFAAALRDYEYATLVGTKTYGKGSMQTVYRLPDGSGLSLTTNKYNPPSNVNYDGVGLEPDIVIELDESLKDKNFYKITDEEDNQLLEACRAIGYNKERALVA
ncbi:MAG: PDZ domain-containing protein [Clostridia bacterium]|nr:PDZ domain-containing protein [Clostridia bacterium]